MLYEKAGAGCLHNLLFQFLLWQVFHALLCIHNGRAYDPAAFFYHNRGALGKLESREKIISLTIQWI